MTTPTFTTPPAVIPARGSSTFSTDASAWVTFQNAFEGELSTAMPWVAARVADVAADLVLTNADVVSTNADVVSTGDDATQTALDRVQTGADVTTTLGYLNAFEDSYIGQYADDAAADASGKTIVDGVFYFKTTATSGLRIYNGGWNAAVLDAAGALLAANNLSDVASASTALGNIGGAPLASPTFTGTPAAPAYEDAVVVLTGTTPTVNLAAAGEYRLTTSGSTTFTVSNPPADGYTTTKTLRITQGGTAYSLTFWAGIEAIGGAIPAAPALNETKEYTLRASTVSGTTIYVLTETGVVS
jgi:hypothetical protein